MSHTRWLLLVTVFGVLGWGAFFAERSRDIPTPSTPSFSQPAAAPIADAYGSLLSYLDKGVTVESSLQYPQEKVIREKLIEFMYAGTETDLLISAKWRYLVKKLKVCHLTRNSILAPPGTVISIPLAVPPESYLQISFAVTDLGGPRRRPVGCKVSWISAGKAVVLLEKSHQDNCWTEDSLDLRPYAGQTGELRLETDAEELPSPPTGNQRAIPPFGIWGDPGIFRYRQPGESNVLLIDWDTARADYLSCYGYKRQTTPHLDGQLIPRGTQFLKNTSQASWTIPSHVSILTSLYTFEHGFMPDLGNFRRRFPKQFPTLPGVLRDYGWRTVGLFDGGQMDPALGFSSGFESYYCRDGSAQDTEALAKWLERLKDSRFLLFYHTYQPHGPYTGTYFVEREGLEFLDPESEKYNRALYAGNLRNTDETTGKIFDHLTRLDLWKNTYVIFLSDHGEDMWDHAANHQRHSDHGHSLYEDQVRTPLVIAGPGLPEGKRTTALTQNIDIFPTLLELLNIPQEPYSLSGRSLVPLLTKGTPVHSVVYSGGVKPPEGPMWALRTERYKYILHPSDGQEQVFDMSKGDVEREPITLSFADLEALRKDLTDRVAGEKTLTSVETGTEPSAEVLESLRSLGYIE